MLCRCNKNTSYKGNDVMYHLKINYNCVTLKLYGNSLLSPSQRKKWKEKEKMFIQIKKYIYYNVYILKLKFSINYSD